MPLAFRRCRIFERLRNVSSDILVRGAARKGSYWGTRGQGANIHAEKKADRAWARPGANGILKDRCASPYVKRMGAEQPNDSTRMWPMRDAVRGGWRIGGQRPRLSELRAAYPRGAGDTRGEIGGAKFQNRAGGAVEGHCSDTRKFVQLGGATSLQPAAKPAAQRGTFRAAAGKRRDPAGNGRRAICVIEWSLT